MATYGLLSTGFVPKTLEVIRDEFNTTIENTIGTTLDLTDATPFGKLIGIWSERLALLWELAEAINTSQDPDQATGARLEALSALTGTLRVAALSSTVTLSLTGTASTTVTTGSQVSNQVTGERFNTLADGTLVLLTVWATTTAYVIGDRRSNDGNCYICTVAGTSAGSGGPTGEATPITDNTVTWAFIGDGLSAIDVAAESANAGAVVGVTYDINTIETPISGWDSAINLDDVALGSALELDEALRLRRETEIANAGAATIDAVRAALLQVSGVTSVTNFWNNTIATDGDGVPAKAVEVLILGGDPQDIHDALLANVGGGIETHGTTAGTATDSEGVVHATEFSRPAEIDIYVDITLTYDATLWPSDGDAQIEAALVVFGDAQATGKDVVSSSLKAACFGVAGVLDVSLAEISTSPSPTLETTIVITSRQLAVHSTARIAVSSSSATP
jgi:uncharacterized phage protein gp47/JayE